MNNNSALFPAQKILALLLSLFFLVALQGSRTKVEGISSLTISDLDIGQFPTLTFYLETHDSSGMDLEGITENDIRIEEDHNTLSADNLQRIEPGIHWITAINAGPRLKDLAGGVYRIESIRSHLSAWMQSQVEDSPNDYSLTTNTGILISKTESNTSWIESLESYQPDFALSQPNLISLSQAIDLSASSVGAVPQKYAVLYITPMLSQEYRTQLPDIAERAKQMGVQVDVWLVGAGNLKNTNVEIPFQQLAEITGGTYFFYSGVEPLPNPSDSLENLRWLYKVQYHSAMKTSGVHEIKLTVLHETVWKESNSLAFQFNVLPPNPIFFSLPTEIIRTPIRSENLGEEDKLEPETVDIRLLVEFPDQYKRGLTLSRLFVNNELVARNTEIPFDTFTWDLSPFTESQTVFLKADIQDEAGFSAETIAIPVQITVQTRRRSFLELVFKYQGWIISAALLLTLFLLGTVFYTFQSRRKFFNSPLFRQKQAPDPLTQAVQIKQLAPISENKLRRKTKLLPVPAPEQRERAIQARLVRLDNFLEEVQGEDILLPQLEYISLGRDAKRVTIVLNDPAVSPVHARILFHEPDEYTLYDEGSIAGTWLNYAPISSLGAQLQYGDMIQFGGLIYRFKSTAPDSEARFLLLPYNEENE
jgi:hypothetical protein